MVSTTQHGFCQWKKPWPSQPTSTASNLCSKACLLSGVIINHFLQSILAAAYIFYVEKKMCIYICNYRCTYIYIYVSYLYMICVSYISFLPFWHYITNPTGECMSPSCVGEQRKLGRKYLHSQKKYVYIKEKQWFLDHFFDPGNPYTFLPNTCHLCQPHVLHSLRSARPTEKNSSWRGKARQRQHIKERMQLLFDGFNMLQYDNMVQYGSKSWWFLVLSNWIECVWCQLLLAYCHLPAIVMSFSLARWESSYRWPLHDFLHCLLQVVSVVVQGLRPSHQKKTESRFAA